MPMVEFSNEEFRLIAENAKKLMEARKELPPQHWRKPQHRAIKDLAARFKVADISERDAATHERILSRTDIRMLEELAVNAELALKGAVITGYEDRIHKQPEKADYYTPYLEKAKRKLALYQSILAKVQEVL